MSSETNTNNILIKSHPKSIIRAISIGSREFENLFSKEPTGEIDGSKCFVVVLQAMICSHYIIVEYARRADYKNFRKGQNNG